MQPNFRLESARSAPHSRYRDGAAEFCPPHVVDKVLNMPAARSAAWPAVYKRFEYLEDGVRRLRPGGANVANLVSPAAPSNVIAIAAR